MNAVVLIAIMAIVTMLLRFLPFIIFTKNTPEYISYLGKVLPAALIGMLVIYCLKDVSVVDAPHGLPVGETPQPIVNGLAGASGRRHAMRTTSAVGISTGKPIGRRIRNIIR